MVQTSMSLAAIPFPLYDQLKARAELIKEVDIKLVTSMLLNVKMDRKNCSDIYKILTVIILKFYARRHPNCTILELRGIYQAQSTVNGTQFLFSNLPQQLLKMVQAYTELL